MFDDKLKEFELKNKVSKEVMKYLYGVSETKFELSPEGKTVVYKEGEELRYKTDGHCGEGAILDEGRRLRLKEAGEELEVDFWDETRMVVVV